MSSTVSPVGVGARSAPVQADNFLNSILDLRPDLQVQGLDAKTVSWLRGLRDRSAAQVQHLSLPTTRNEEWRFTDLSSLRQVRFQTGDLQVKAENLPELAPLRLVFVNGIYGPQHSTVSELPPGVFVGPLSELPARSQAQLQRYLAQQQGAEDLFTTLNTASFRDAAILWIPKNQEVKQPIYLVFQTTTGKQPAVAPRCLVVAESSSTVTLIEDYCTAGEAVALTNAVTEIFVAANAQVNHTRIQRENGEAYHIGKTAIAQERDSHYTCHAVSLGAKLSRHHLEVYQQGEQTETVLNGLTLARGHQLADTHSLIAYSHPHSRSRQLHKCIVDDRAHGVFNGKVFVPKAAQLTDAGQLNRNLLLSPKARVDTKPQLEIIADNVKCTHGATVSQLDAEEIFYLQSRGLDRASASKLLVEAFAIETLEQIPVESVQNFLSEIVLQRVQ